MRRILYPILLTVPLFFFACNNQSQKQDNHIPDSKSVQQPAEKENIPLAQLQSYQQRLTGYFDTMLLRRNFNGSILVAKGGHILYEAYQGYANPSKKTDTITLHTSFHLASTSKPFTGVAVMKLVEQGKISLHDNLKKYFPAFPYEGVTVEQLLSHRSGLPNYLFAMDNKDQWDQKRMVFNKDVLDFLIQFQPPISYAPGTRFHYCNTNYVLLALIIEKVTGIPFPQYLKQTIFDPLGMEDTYVYTPADSAQSIMSYKPSGALWANDKYEYTYGDKNVYSTPRDMYRWDSALYRHDFISKAILDSSHMPRSHEKFSVHNYGYGWRMLNLPHGKNVIYHNGKWHGFTPAFARLIDEKAVIIILGNKYSKNIYDAAKHAYDIFGKYMQTTNSPEEEDSQLTTPMPPVVRPVKTQATPKLPNANRQLEKRKSATAVKTPHTRRPVTSTKTEKEANTITVTKHPATVTKAKAPAKAASKPPASKTSYKKKGSQ